MKYIIRAAKYFVYLALLLVVFIAILSALKIVGSDVDSIFRNGKDSLWQIALIMAVFAAVYPRLGFGRRTAFIPGAFQDIRGGVADTMQRLGYELEKEDGENLSFRLSGGFPRFRRMFEDRITMTRNISGFECEGPNRDLVRVISALEDRFRQE